MRILAFEIKKLFSPLKLLLIFLSLALGYAICFIPSADNLPYSKEIYKSYMNTLSGEYTQEKKELILEEYNSFCETIDMYDEIQTDYKENRITLEDFDEYNLEYNSALSKISTVEYLITKCEYFDSIKGECEFFYDTDCLDFLDSLGLSYPAAIVIIFFAIAVFCPEFQSGSYSVVLTTQNGRAKTCAIKLTLTFILAFIISFSFCMVEYIAFLPKITSFAGMPIKNIIGYSGFDNLTIWQYFLLNTLKQSFSWSVSAVYISLISNITKSSIFTAFISFVTIACISMLMNTAASDLQYLLLAGGISNKLTCDFNVIKLSAILLVKLAIYSIASIALWNKRMTK